MALTVIDLFSGVGGFALGFMQARNGLPTPLFDIRLLVDTDKEAAFTFKRNHPLIPFLLTDIRNLAAEEALRHAGLKEVDVVIGGPPCQGFSTAGKRVFDDKRNELLKDFVRLVADLKPKAALMENVPSLLGALHGAYAAELIERLSQKGYWADAKVLQATDYGVPQIRKRAFVIAFRKDLGITPSFPQATPQSDRGFVSAEDAIGDLPALRSGDSEDPRTYRSAPKTGYQRDRRAGSICIFNHVSRKHADWFLQKLSVIPEGGGNRDLDPELQFSDTYFSQAYARLSRGEPAYTITTCFLNPGSGRFIHYTDLRSITAREAARLQSFDDAFIFHGTFAAQERHIGNAVPPLLARAWANHIASALGAAKRPSSNKITKEREAEIS